MKIEKNTSLEPMLCTNRKPCVSPFKRVNSHLKPNIIATEGCPLLCTPENRCPAGRALAWHRVTLTTNFHNSIYFSSWDLGVAPIDAEEWAASIGESPMSQLEKKSQVVKILSERDIERDIRFLIDFCNIFCARFCNIFCARFRL